MIRYKPLTLRAVKAIHRELIEHYGGSYGLRDPGALESALARPANLASYRDKVTIPQLAASYGWGLLRNHPFVDGNKRIALMAVHVFLAVNGWELAASEIEETDQVLRVAAGGVLESEWEAWVVRASRRQRSARRFTIKVD